ncbi:MAG: triose-phosphate isomerase [Clostridia bacterium]|nr:triose-phosphate isomerase [Clostridia bacterium]
MRRPLIAGNWKMHNTINEARALLTALLPQVRGSRCQVVVCPPFTCLAAVAELCAGSEVGVGAQDVFWEEKGAFTGEISPPMLKEAGCSHVIIGHSERRQYFGETDLNVNRKAKAALQHGLVPIICVGETLEEREAGVTKEICRRQLEGALQGVTAAQAEAVVVAYEPVWAIGTGRSASAADAQEVIAYIRELLSGRFGKQVAAKVRILYGGSVKPENTAELMAKPDIDGALVGGASLDASSFASIIKLAEAACGYQSN